MATKKTKQQIKNWLKSNRSKLSYQEAINYVYDQGYDRKDFIPELKAHPGYAPNTKYAPMPGEPTGPGTIGPVFPIPSSPQLPGQPPPTGEPRPFPQLPGQLIPGQIDYTKIPGWDKLTPQEQELLKVMVDGLKSPLDIGSIPAFNFDEALAQQASEAQYKPFFQEKLSDVFYQTQRAKQQAEEDYAKRLGISSEELRQSLEDITGQREQLGLQEQRGLEDIGLQRERGLKSLAESAAERGLTFSGIRGKEEQQYTGDIAKEQGRMQQDIARGFEDLSKGEYRTRTGFGTQSDLLAQARQRTLEDQARTEALAQRDITRQQQEAITGGVLQRRGEALQPYWYYFQKLAGGQ